PDGVGRLQLDDGSAYGEPFEKGTANLRFERTGVRLDAINLAKNTGSLTGAAWIGWDGTYSFEANGNKIPVESLASLRYPSAPLSGILQFTANGAGAFSAPHYDVK